MGTEENNNEEFEDGFLGAEILVDDREFGSAYPLIQWMNGSPKGKAVGKDSLAHTGGFFMSADQGIEPPPGFEPYTLTTEGGDDVEGFSSRDLTFAPIRSRRSWLVDMGEGNFPLRFANNDYDDAKAAAENGTPKGVGHLVVGIKGCDEPILLSFRGMTSREIFSQGRNLGLIPNYSNKILRAAKRVARKANPKSRKKYPLCAFLMTVGPNRNDKGAPEFTKVGQGDKTRQITMPVWLDEPKGLVGKADLTRIYVGGESLATYQDFHMELDDWFEAWSPETLSARRNGDVPAGATEPVPDPALPGEKEIPF